MADNNDKPNKIVIPDDTIKSFARRLLPAIQAYYNSDVGKRDFEEWKAKKEKAEDKA